MLNKVLEFMKKFHIPQKMGSLTSHTCSTPWLELDCSTLFHLMAGGVLGVCNC